jgi:hypothetical protein
MKNSPCQLVAVLATIQLSERSPAMDIENLMFIRSQRQPCTGAHSTC